MNKMKTLYELVDNPINDRFIDNISDIYSYSDDYEDFKDIIINYTKKSPKRNIKYEEELFKYLEDTFNTEFVSNNDVINVKNTNVDNDFSLVLNTNYNATMKLTKIFIKDCLNKNLPIDVSFNINGETDHSLVIGTNNDTINDYMKELKELGNRFPKLFSDIKEPGLLIGRVNDKYGICSSTYGMDDFYDRRCKELYDVVEYSYLNYINNNHNAVLEYKDKKVPIVRFLAYYTNDKIFEKIRNSKLNDKDFENTYGITKDQKNDDEFFYSIGFIVTDKLEELFNNKEIIENGSIKLDKFEIEYFLGDDEEDTYNINLNKDELFRAFKNASYDIIRLKPELSNGIKKNISDMCYMSGIDKDNYSFDHDSINIKDNNLVNKKKI